MSSYSTLFEDIVDGDAQLVASSFLPLLSKNGSLLARCMRAVASPEPKLEDARRIQEAGWIYASFALEGLDDGVEEVMTEEFMDQCALLASLAEGPQPSVESKDQPQKSVKKNQKTKLKFKLKNGRVKKKRQGVKKVNGIKEVSNPTETELKKVQPLPKFRLVHH
uniref:Uncharacterized protein n=1 Tax=Steinernema glaseri TaxID=37863 RepID=A0A1I7ZE47_9BILA